MEEQNEKSVTFKSVRWNRRVLNGFWSLVVLFGILEGFNSLVIRHGQSLTIKHSVVLSVGIQVLIVALSEVLIRSLPSNAENVLIVVMTFLVMVLIVTVSNLQFLSSFVLLPLIVSMFSFNTKKVIFTVFLNILGYSLLFWFVPKMHPKYVEFVSIDMVLVVGGYIALGILSRGVEIEKSLSDLSHENQDLRIQKTVAERTAKVDGLTQIYNQSAFHQFLSSILEYASRNMNVYLLIADIDDFKHTNDQFGHQAGDEVLKMVASCIQTEVRSQDFVARYGGEEFAIVLTEITAEEAEKVAERIRNRIATTFIQEINGYVTVSIGMEEFRPEYSKEEFFQRADALLYQAKGNGKNQVVTSKNRC
ncbi:GGDEF domain-containing protein [Alicyclobacillus tolerans]|uniref:GGDEF domain-containing protein n=1 Tax=Alicyclobacillus tolerans TaxID=90970 RepID=UPI001F414DD2|nr:GGDEF domain-containing protein [Alicyclobacillus tolerans]MCF8564853.1 GGDEF domain-containing protein [Alicyclobacillus tolerans]